MSGTASMPVGSGVAGGSAGGGGGSVATDEETFGYVALLRYFHFVLY